MMRSPLVRFALNFIVYLVFGGAILAFTAQRVVPAGGTPAVPFEQIVGAALAVALWSGTLTTLIETRVNAMADPIKRALTAGLLGGLSLGGFATILSSVAWRRPELGFIAIGVAAGALMQAARAFSLGARRGGHDDNDDNGGKDMDVKQLIANGALVLDVRNQDEWDAGHLASAKLLPADQVAGKLDTVETWAGGKDKAIVVHCKGGGRAGRVRSVLLAAGFTNVINGGGYDALK